MTVLPNASVHNAVMWGTVDYVLGDIAHWIAMGPAWDPNNPTSVPCFDSPSPPPPPPPPPKVVKPKPKPQQKPHPKEKWFAKFVDEEEMRNREIASAKYYAMGRRMEEEGETMKDVKEGVVFEEELMNTKVPESMTKNRKPKKFLDDPKATRSILSMVVHQVVGPLSWARLSKSRLPQQVSGRGNL